MKRCLSLLLPCMLSLMLATTLGGCARVKSLVRSEPPPPPAARTVAIRVHAASRLNTDNRGQPLALLVRIYKLRQSAAFEQAAFETFMNAESERAVLGTDLLEVKEVVLVPGQRYDVLEKVAPEVGYIGVVGLFRSPAPQRWRLAFASAAAQKSGITVGAHGCALAAGAGAPALGQDPATLTPAHCR